MSQSANGSEYSSILVIGGGISGMTSAVEAAEVGREVYLVEKESYLGGRVAKLNQYFPKLCPPSCGLEINFRRIKQNHKVRLLTSTVVEAISGSPGSYEVTLKTAPKFVNDNCTACGDCENACDVLIDSEFDYGLGKTKAFYLPYQTTYPMKYTVRRDALTDEQFAKCKAACQYNAIEDAPESKTFNIKVGSIIVATGWKPYDAAAIENLGHGQYKNVITNVQMERLAAISGPTQGNILRPSDNKPAKKVAFVQCAGSRDENYLPYCSGVCCLASLKHTFYLREKDAESVAEIFYIDIRALGRLEDFLNRVKKDENVTLTKGKVAKIEQDDATGDVLVTVEDILGGGKLKRRFDMVVLATGMQPVGLDVKTSQSLMVDDYGFVFGGNLGDGIYGAGCAKRPCDVSTCVQDATAAAAKAMTTR